MDRSGDPQSERLTFHRQSLADFADSAAMWADADTTRHIGGKPSTPEESWARLLRNAGHWSLLGYGFWAIREKHSNRFLGEIGFKQFRRSLDPALDALPEAGWVLAPWGRRQGFATEAVRAMLTWADNCPAWPETLCMIDPENGPSLRIASTSGYVELAAATYKEKPVRLFRRTLPPA